MEKWIGIGLGINKNREYLNHLWFADDIFLLSESSDELQEILNYSNRKNLIGDLKINKYV